MKYITLIFTLMTAFLTQAATGLPQQISNEIFSAIGDDPQITIVYGHKPDHLVRYFGVRDVICTKGTDSQCKMDNTPPNENVTPMELRGAKADQLIAILNRIQPSALTHKGFDCAYSEKTQQTECWVY